MFDYQRDPEGKQHLKPLVIEILQFEPTPMPLARYSVTIIGGKSSINDESNGVLMGYCDNLQGGAPVR